MKPARFAYLRADSVRPAATGGIIGGHQGVISRSKESTLEARATRPTVTVTPLGFWNSLSPARAVWLEVEPRPCGNGRK